MQGFSPEISWSHYRALMRVDSVEARNFYEKERRLIEATLEERDSE
jgi:predicted nuclease of restriction endonuclease-like (RecB) superfamily